MTLEEIEETLPNGLHDALINRLNVDYGLAQLTLEVDVWVGLLDEPPPERERSALAEILFTGLVYCSIEHPQPGSSFLHPGEVFFSYERTPAEEIPSALVKVLPQDTQCYSLFILEWCSKIHIAAKDVTFSWTDGRAQR